MSLDPLVILAIGIITVLGLILVLRVNAFLALITAAIVVSLLAPGETSAKIARVAAAFGSASGKIAIVIALAAIIGECMMLSGAADRVVQAFLNLLGEKRTPWALLSSGYILAVPVFFDTVFYLLVPLARSLYRRTRKRYLLSILAIAAGGAVTHTLVPPTPGPLLMAANLGIDVGLMIIVGAAVALPAAVAGLFVSSLLDARLQIPYRELPSASADTPAETPSLPPLGWSLLPVLLPVLMISANTALSTLADNEGVARFSTTDITDWNGFQSVIQSADASQPSPAARVRALLPPETIAQLDGDAALTGETKQSVVSSFNALLSSTDVGVIIRSQGRDAGAESKKWLYDDAAFEAVVQPTWKLKQQLALTSGDDQERIQRRIDLNDLLQQDRKTFKRHEREHFQRLALEVAFPQIVRPHTYDSELRQWSGVTSLFGDANFSLLLSTIVALGLYWKQRQPTLGDISKMVEQALMSAGVIILITAGGGAFGEMLKAANIGTRIESLFAGDSQSAAGLTYIFLGFGIAAVLKVAQGSSTVAMITGSAMIAAMLGADAKAMLGFHPVYLATAIGGGSLLGSWMNDSGFWIFAKMGGLTETEALKSWSVMLCVLSVVSLIMSILLAFTLPLMSVA